ncbi:MAG: alternative ribosome rescue aminoacyl-tRNA hydrolase ArfB [Phycisphaerales bacterium]
MKSDSHQPDPNQPGDGTLVLAPGVRVPASVVQVTFSRSSGPGGQNVNKVSTKCEIRLATAALPLHPAARHRLESLAASRLTAAGEIIITSETERSQSRNRDECFEKLRQLLVQAMHIPKVRRPTKPSRGSKERRLTAKKIRGEIKRNRRDED